MSGYSISNMRKIRIIVRKLFSEKTYVYMSEQFRLVKSIFYIGSKYHCSICKGRFRKLLDYGVIKRTNAKCPRCGCLERHRLLWLYLENRTDFFRAPLKILDIAPPKYFQDKIRKHEKIDYLSADLSSASTMVEMDITDIQLPNDQFDCIICYHVLEHIPDDKKAMKELYRVLKPGGWAIIQSFSDNKLEKTFEDPSITSPEERERLFGLSDHVRVYGRDYKERLEGAGFTIRMDDYVKELGEEKTREYCLPSDEIIYYSTKVQS